MSETPVLYTATMAKLYADQGYLRKAAEIYRYLAAQDPGRSDVQAALAAVERQLAERRVPGRKELVLLLREWMELMKTQTDRHSSGRKRHEE